MKKILTILVLGALLYGGIYLVQHMNREVAGYNQHRQENDNKSSEAARKAMGK